MTSCASFQNSEFFFVEKAGGGGAAQLSEPRTAKKRCSPQCGSRATVRLMPGAVVLPGRLGRSTVIERSLDCPGRADAVGLSSPTKSRSAESICERYCEPVTVGTQYWSPLSGVYAKVRLAKPSCADQARIAAPSSRPYFSERSRTWALTPWFTRAASSESCSAVIATPVEAKPSLYSARSTVVCASIPTRAG